MAKNGGKVLWGGTSHWFECIITSVITGAKKVSNGSLSFSLSLQWDTCSSPSPPPLPFSVLTRQTITYTGKMSVSLPSLPPYLAINIINWKQENKQGIKERRTPPHTNISKQTNQPDTIQWRLKWRRVWGGRSTPVKTKDDLCMCVFLFVELKWCVRGGRQNRREAQ